MKLLVPIILFLVPAISAFGAFGYEQSKVVVFTGLVLALSSVWIFSKHTFNHFGRLLWVSLGLIGIFTLTSITGLGFLTSLFGTYPYFQGLLLYLVLFLWAILVATFPVDRLKIALAIIGSAVFVSLWALVEYIGLHFLSTPTLTYAGRVVSTFGQPNLFSGLSLLSLPFAVQLLKHNPKYKWAILVFLGIIVAGIGVSESRTAMLISGVYLGVLLLNQLKINQRLKNGLVIGVVALALLVGFSSLLSREVKTQTAESRTVLWEVFGNIVEQRPLLGYGLENIGKSYQNYFAGIEHYWEYPPMYVQLRDLYVDRAHNYFLDIWLYSGLSGLLVYIWLMVLTYKHSEVEWRHFLVLFLIWSSFQIPGMVHLMLLWVAIGLAVSKK